VVEWLTPLSSFSPPSVVLLSCPSFIVLYVRVCCLQYSTVQYSTVYILTVACSIMIQYYVVSTC
jgi:hypothetical protein